MAGLLELQHQSFQVNLDRILGTLRVISRVFLCSYILKLIICILNCSESCFVLFFLLSKTFCSLIYLFIFLLPDLKCSTGKTQSDGMGREVGGRIVMGNTCKSMADSCQCMAKTTTIL